jgi:hypothetical protein
MAARGSRLAIRDAGSGMRDPIRISDERSVMSDAAV